MQNKTQRVSGTRTGYLIQWLIYKCLRDHSASQYWSISAEIRSIYFLNQILSHCTLVEYLSARGLKLFICCNLEAAFARAGASLLHLPHLASRAPRPPAFRSPPTSPASPSQAPLLSLLELGPQGPGLLSIFTPSGIWSSPMALYTVLS